MAAALAIWWRLSPASSYTNISTPAFKTDILFFLILPHYLNLVAASLKFLPGETCRVVKIVQVEEKIRHNLRVETPDPCLSLEFSLKSGRTCGCLATS